LNVLDKSTSKVVLIGLGSNLDPEKNIRSALFLLEKQLTLLGRASIWRTPPIGSSGPDYLNTAVLAETQLTLDQLKSDVLLEIEDYLGRIRVADKYADRTLDLDILIYAGRVIDNDIWTQPHLTVPAAELLPTLINQQTGETLSQAAERLLPGTQFHKLDNIFD